MIAYLVNRYVQVVTNLFDIFMTFQAEQDLLVFGNSILQGGLCFVECVDLKSAELGMICADKFEFV